MTCARRPASDEHGFTIPKIGREITGRAPATKRPLLGLIRNKPIRFPNGTVEYSFSRLWDRFATDRSAMQARDAAFLAAVMDGRRAERYTLEHQCRPWSGVDQPEDRCCSVYKLRVWDDAQPSEEQDDG